MKYTDYYHQAQNLAELSVELLNELQELDVDTAYCEILCRALYKYGYINMRDDYYVLEFISNGRANVKRRKYDNKQNDNKE